MKKVFYYAMIILMMTSFVGFIYSIVVGSSNCIYLMFMSIITGLMGMMVEDGTTEQQQNKLFGTLIGVIGVIIILLMMTSCSSSRDGYGCKGKESWNHLERRINRP